MTTQQEVSERDLEIGRLETEIIKAWVAGGERLPMAALNALLTSAIVAAEGYPSVNAQAKADRALDRLRKAAEAMREYGKVAG